MASINSITLTDALPHTGKIQVVDDQGNVYNGNYSNPVLALADDTQDTATIDPATPDSLIVQEKNPTGGTTAVLTIDWESQGNNSPEPDSTAMAIPDGTILKGLSCQVALINNVTFSLKLQVAF